MKNQHILIQVANEILSNPDILDMNDFYNKQSGKFCIGGLSIATLHPEARKDYYGALYKLYPSHSGSGSLGILREIFDVNDETVRKIINVCEWDEPFYNKYEQANTPQERAKIASDYIRHFLSQQPKEEITMNYNQFKRIEVIKAAMDDGARELLQQTLTKKELKNLQIYLKEFCEKTSDTEVKGIQIVEENNPQEFLSDIRSSMFKSLSEQKVTEYGSFLNEFDISKRAVCVYGLHTGGRFMITVSTYNPSLHDQVDEIQQAEQFLEDLRRGVYFDEPLVGYGYESEYENIRRDNPYINNNDLVFEHLKECCGNQSKISANMEDEEWAISFFVTNKTK